MKKVSCKDCIHKAVFSHYGKKWLICLSEMVQPGFDTEHDSFWGHVITKEELTSFNECNHYVKIKPLEAMAQRLKKTK